MKCDAQEGWLKGAFTLGVILAGTTAWWGSFQSALAQEQTIDMQEGQILNQKNDGAVEPQIHTGIPVNLALSSVITWRPGNYTFSFGSNVLVPLTNTGYPRSVPFTTSGHVTVQYTAECAVGAPLGNYTTYLNIDIELVDYNTGTVIGLPPTNQTNDAFCTANGTGAVDGWRMSSITGVHLLLSAGTYVAQVRANLRNGVFGSTGHLGDSTLIIRK